MDVVNAQSVSKKYLISENQGPIRLADGFSNWLKSKKKQEFWALRNVNFSIQEGDKLGIIGNNGAGKSTLLKILSKITKPSTGSIVTKGKVASLLEVGTGFHPELTGRENIYLNGAILGMSRKEIQSKFDEIVDFAGPQLQQFLDTPVKRYSSGMYVRLGFAISAHLEPDILVVDEVLAVGDADFQKKSLGKMKEVSSKDKTILFVSHNMTAVSNLCNKTLHMEKGQVKAFGATGEVLSRYLSEQQKNVLVREYTDPNLAPGNDLVRLKFVELKPEWLENQEYMDVRNSMNLHLEFWNFSSNAALNLSLHVFSSTGECIFNVGSEMNVCHEGSIMGRLHIPGHFLNDGAYTISCMVVKDKNMVLHNFEDLLNFEIADHREDTTWYGKWPGYVRPQFKFSLEQVNPS